MEQKGYSKELKSEVILAAIKAQQPTPSSLCDIGLHIVLPLLFQLIIFIDPE
ncbi:MAG: hypothetical protein NTY00_00585 [Deltaproteobacteria bacterium]|nr:hypothetical protein [Deltaproteobacteria bacterium]